MWKERLEKLLEIIKIWIDITLKRVRDNLIAKYPVEQKNTLLSSDNEVIKAFKDSIKTELSEELRENLFNQLKDKIEQQVIQEISKIQQQNPIITDEVEEPTSSNDQEVEESIVDSIEEGDVEDTNDSILVAEEEDSSDSFSKDLEKLSIINNIEDIEDELNDYDDSRKLASLIIDHVKTSQAPSRYEKLASILTVQSDNSIQLQIPPVAELFDPELQELTKSRHSTTEQNKGKIVKLIRPGIIIEGEVVNKARVEVWM